MKTPGFKICKYSKCKKNFIPTQFAQPVCNYKCALGYNQEKKEAKEQKEIDDKVKEMRPFAKSNEYKKSLQRVVNMLARLIDIKLGYNSCIDCGRTYGKQTDAAHYHSIGSNSTLRYNLHNLHSAASYCNFHSDLHKTNYKIGLANRYGQKYADKVEHLGLVYKEIHLTPLEVVEKLKVVRGLIRNLHTFEFENGMQAREILNRIIGIYT